MSNRMVYGNIDYGVSGALRVNSVWWLGNMGNWESV